MMTVFYSKEAQFDLNEDEFEAFIKKAKSGEKVWIPRLKVFLSNMFVWAGEKPVAQNKRQLHDGGSAIEIFGVWYDEYSGAKMDLHYYPELTKDIDYKQLNQNNELGILSRPKR